MRFEVPQFIEIEDKIFGPLTWRQFLYLGGGVGMAVVMFFTLPFFIFLFFGFPLAALSGALSFYPINNRPFSFFLEAVINYISSQHLYLWRQKADVVHKQSSLQMRGSDTPPISFSPNPSGKNITTLARRLELQALQKPKT